MNKVILMWFRGTPMIWPLLVGVHFLVLGRKLWKDWNERRKSSSSFLFSPILGCIPSSSGSLLYQRVPHKLQCFTPPCLYFLPVSWNLSLNIFYVANVYSYFISFIHLLLQNISLYSWDGNMPSFCLCAL